MRAFTILATVFAVAVAQTTKTVTPNGEFQIAFTPSKDAAGAHHLTLQFNITNWAVNNSIAAATNPFVAIQWTGNAPATNQDVIYCAMTYAAAVAATPE